MLTIPVESFGSLTETECIKIQEELAFHIQQNSNFKVNHIRTIAGVDLAYWENADERAVCCIVVVDAKNNTILEKVSATGPVIFPYIPGCLAFRELPLVIDAAQKLKISPDIYMFDGNGFLHPRHMGLASHASFYLNRPTFGVAKSYFKIDNTEFEMPENRSGCFTDIIIQNEIYGRAVRTHKDVKPIFVSVGNDIDLDTATILSLSLTEPSSHIPIPTRFADLETHSMRKILYSAK